MNTNEMKQQNAHEVSQSSSGDVVHVVMSLFSETAEVEITVSITRSSVQNRMSTPFIHTETSRTWTIYI